MDCQWCGTTLLRRKGRGRPRTRFCTTKCNNDYQNNRQTRGALIYDLAMIWRNERSVEKDYEVRKLMSRLVADFRLEDINTRDGRKSWDDIDTVIGRMVHLRHTYKGYDGTGRKRL